MQPRSLADSVHGSRAAATERVHDYSLVIRLTERLTKTLQSEFRASEEMMRFWEDSDDPVQRDASTSE
jgi:hypothetical protein